MKLPKKARKNINILLFLIFSILAVGFAFGWIVTIPYAMGYLVGMLSWSSDYKR